MRNMTHPIACRRGVRSVAPPYRFDLHVHTSEVSPCGTLSAAEMASAYHNAGFDGILITDHLTPSYFDSLPCRDDWQACVDAYLSGYRAARLAGDTLGLTVALGAEIRFPGSMRDYLLFGLTEDYLRAHPYLYRADPPSFFRDHGSALVIVQAHPYRNNDDVCFESLHGLEIINCNTVHDSRNALALHMAQAHPHLIRTAGSDSHILPDVGLSATLFDAPVADSLDIRRALLSGAYSLSCPSFQAVVEENERDLTETKRRASCRMSVTPIK